MLFSEIFCIFFNWYLLSQPFKREEWLKPKLWHTVMSTIFSPHKSQGCIFFFLYLKKHTLGTYMEQYQHIHDLLNLTSDYINQATTRNSGVTVEDQWLAKDSFLFSTTAWNLLQPLIPRGQIRYHLLQNLLALLFDFIIK